MSSETVGVSTSFSTMPLPARMRAQLPRLKSPGKALDPDILLPRSPRAIARCAEAISRTRSASTRGRAMSRPSPGSASGLRLPLDRSGRLAMISSRNLSSSARARSRGSRFRRSPGAANIFHTPARRSPPIRRRPPALPRTRDCAPDSRPICTAAPDAAAPAAPLINVLGSAGSIRHSLHAELKGGWGATARKSWRAIGRSASSPTRVNSSPNSETSMSSNPS